MPRLAVIAIVLLGFIAACEKGAPVPPGNVAARLALPTADGATFDPATLAGKPTVVVFWRPGCPHCRDELPHVLKACKDKGANAVAVQVSESPASGQRVLDGLKWDGAVLTDDGTVRKELKIDKVPWTLVLRPDGTAARSYVGAQTYGTLAGAIAAAK
jgi:thiol-disulfide isomerase/thioredoxin